MDGRARIRWERSGAGNGRVYQISFSASDGYAGVSQGAVSVCVPHHRGQTCVDDGQRYNSLLCEPRRADRDAAVLEPATPLALPAAQPGGVNLRYALPREGTVKLEVFDVAGRRVATLVEGHEKAGFKEVRWDPGRVASGTYLYRLQAGEFVHTRRLVILR